MAGEMAGQVVSVPSGQELRVMETVWDAPGPSGLTLRLRFVAPAISREGGTVDFETAAADMAHLCAEFAQNQGKGSGPVPQQIIISLSDRDVPFGEVDDQATQYFEAYRIEDGRCIWEPF